MALPAGEGDALLSVPCAGQGVPPSVGTVLSPQVPGCASRDVSEMVTFEGWGGGRQCPRKRQKRQRNVDDSPPKIYLQIPRHGRPSVVAGQLPPSCSRRCAHPPARRWPAGLPSAMASHPRPAPRAASYSLNTKMKQMGSLYVLLPLLLYLNP